MENLWCLQKKQIPFHLSHNALLDKYNYNEFSLACLQQIAHLSVQLHFNDLIARCVHAHSVSLRSQGNWHASEFRNVNYDVQRRDHFNIIWYVKERRRIDSRCGMDWFSISNATVTRFISRTLSLIRPTVSRLANALPAAVCTKSALIREPRLSNARRRRWMGSERCSGEKRRSMLDNYHTRSMKVTRAATWSYCTYVGIIGPRHAILKSTMRHTASLPRLPCLR